MCVQPLAVAGSREGEEELGFFFTQTPASQSLTLDWRQWRNPAVLCFCARACASAQPTAGTPSHLAARQSLRAGLLHNEEEGGCAHPYAGGELCEAAPAGDAGADWGQGSGAGGQPALHAVQGPSQSAAHCAVVLQKGPVPQQVCVCMHGSGGGGMGHDHTIINVISIVIIIIIIIIIMTHHHHHQDLPCAR